MATVYLCQSLRQYLIEQFASWRPQYQYKTLILSPLPIHHPPNLYLLTMKECTSRKVLKLKDSYIIPFTHPARPGIYTASSRTWGIPTTHNFWKWVLGRCRVIPDQLVTGILRERLPHVKIDILESRERCENTESEFYCSSAGSIWERFFT